MEKRDVEKGLNDKSLKLISKPNAKSSVCDKYWLILDTSSNSVGYVQCKSCKQLLANDSKSTGTSGLSRHSEI